MSKRKWNLEWSDAMSVGIAEIDEDHKRFIVLIDELNRAIIERCKGTEIHRRLLLVIEDANRHFEHEEELLRLRGYPNAEGHASSHNNIRNTFKNILDSCIPYGLEAEWLDAALVIKEMLIGHLQVEDMAYANYFKSERRL